jgi:glycosyltransferase involved in cell wall biosynthesis
LNIGQFSDSFLPVLDGVGRVVVSYAEGLCRKGHRCYVIAPMNDIGYRGGLPFDLIDFSSVNIPQYQYKAGTPVLDRHYIERIGAAQLDIAHCHSPFIAGAEAIRISKKQRIPLIGTFHSKYYEDFYKATRSEELAEIGTMIVLSFYNQCDEVWAVSAASAKELQSYGYKREVRVMPNGTEIRQPDINAVREIERLYDLRGEPVILYVGQLNWKKNILRILEAAAMLKREGRAFTLVLAGQGPDSAKIKDKAEELGLASVTRFTGHITDAKLLDALYARALVFAFPSLYDTAGLVVREAAVMGTASVVAEGSGPAESITNRVNGMICRDSSQSLRDALFEFLSSESLANNLGAAAKATLAVSWDDMLDDVVNRYEDMIEYKAGKLTEKRHRIYESRFIGRKRLK